MFALNIGIVVVRNAENPTMSGLYSWTAATNFSGATCTPRSMTWNPAPSNMMLTRFLPMSCTSPLTVPITIVPMVSTPVSASSGRRISSAPAIALPAMSISGTKKSPRSNLAPTSSSDGISASYSSSSGPSPMARPWLVRLRTAGLFPTSVSSYNWLSSSSLVMLLSPARLRGAFEAPPSLVAPASLLGWGLGEKAESRRRRAPPGRSCRTRLPVLPGCSLAVAEDRGQARGLGDAVPGGRAHPVPGHPAGRGRHRERRHDGAVEAVDRRGDRDQARLQFLVGDRVPAGADAGQLGPQRRLAGDGLVGAPVQLVLR